MERAPAPEAAPATDDVSPRRRAVVIGADDVRRTIGQPGLLERAGAAEVVYESPTRFEILLQRLRGEHQAPPDLPATLEEWFATFVSTEAGAEDVSLVVTSLRHELLGPDPWRHVSTGLLVEPPAVFEQVWDEEAIAWLRGQCEPTGAVTVSASIEALRRIVDELHGGGRTLLVLTVSTYDPTDTTFSYAGIADTFALRAHRLTAEIQRLALERDVGFVDVDTAIAELGAADNVPAAGDFTDDAARFITEEAIFAFDQAALFGASVQPAVMRLAVPAFDRRTERGNGRLLRWHVGPKTAITRGDELFDVLFEDLPLRVDHDEADRDKRRPTTGRRVTRKRSLTVNVVAASDGFLSDVLVAEGDPVSIGDDVAVVTPVEPDSSPAITDATGEFRVATRRGAVNRETEEGRRR